MNEVTQVAVDPMPSVPEIEGALYGVHGSFVELNPAPSVPVIEPGTWAKFPGTSQGAFYIWRHHEDDLIVWNLDMTGAWCGYSLSAAEKLPNMVPCDPPACAQTLYRLLGVSGKEGEQP